jgi:DivIVA domain-containing protein
MDVSPELVRQARFRQHRRGYDPTEVDAFLDRLAEAIGDLQDQLAAAVARTSGSNGSAALEAANERARAMPQTDAGPLGDELEALRARAEELRVRMVDGLRQQLAWLEGPEARLPVPPAAQGASDGEQPAATLDPEDERPADGGALAAAAAGDPYLAELQRAFTDDEPLGPRDHRPHDHATGGGDHERVERGVSGLDLAPASVFRRRKRRGD